MTYLDLINRSDKLIKEHELNKNIVLQVIYNVVPDINSMTDLTLILNDEIPAEYLKPILDALQEHVINRKPLPYILGSTTFCKENFIVDEHVLIPRPETEEWTYILLDLIKDCGKIDVLDLCCGTGVIGLTVKKKYPYMNVTLTDIAKSAYENTCKNAKRFNLDVNVVLGNLFENIGDRKFDVIAFNPPYVDTSYELDSYARKEPYNAIYAPNRGMWFYEVIIKNIKKYLKPNYLVIMEIGFDLAGNVGLLIEKYLKAKYEVLTDSRGIDRVVIVNQLEGI